MQQVPELAGRELTLTALSGGITNRNFRVDARRHGRPLGHPPGRQRHAPARHQPGGRACRDGRRGRGRRRARGDRVHPARGLPRHAVHRRLAGVGRGGPSAGHAPRESRDSLRRIHDGPAIPGLFVPLRIVEAYRALALARGVPIPPEYDLASAVGRRIEGALLAAPIELRPCHNDLLNANFIDDGAADPDHRLGVRRDGRPVLRPRQLQHQPRADGRRGPDPAGGVRRRASSPPGSPA